MKTYQRKLTHPYDDAAMVQRRTERYARQQPWWVIRRNAREADRKAADKMGRFIERIVGGIVRASAGDDDGAIARPTQVH